MSYLHLLGNHKTSRSNCAHLNNFQCVKTRQGLRCATRRQEPRRSSHHGNKATLVQGSTRERRGDILGQTRRHRRSPLSLGQPPQGQQPCPREPPLFLPQQRRTAPHDETRPLLQSSPNRQSEETQETPRPRNPCGRYSRIPPSRHPVQCSQNHGQVEK